MTEKEKQRFQAMAENDKKRYDLEMQNYVPPKDMKVSGRGRKRQQIKDPNAPKRSLWVNGLDIYLIYCLFNEYLGFHDLIYIGNTTFGIK